MLSGISCFSVALILWVPEPQTEITLNLTPGKDTAFLTAASEKIQRRSVFLAWITYLSEPVIMAKGMGYLDWAADGFPTEKKVLL